MDTERPNGALSHIRVLDMSRVLAGPWSGQILADLGADVIEVERPGSGDDTRGWGPPFVPDGQGTPSADAAYFFSANRGKRSLTVDISQPDGQALIRRLAARSDILLENFKVGALARYGLDYVSLSALNRGLIYCSITGFGQDGPYRDRPGYDFMIQAMGGLMSITGEADDRPGGGPQKVGVALADILSGMYATVAVLAALAHRERSGEGQYVDLALLDVQVACLANQAMNYLASGSPPGRLGNAHPNIVPYQAFPTADGHIILAVGNDQQFARFCESAGRAELAADERFRTNTLRVQNRLALVPVIEKIMVSRTSQHWLTGLAEVNVPCGPINTLDKVFDDPQVRFRGMRTALEHATCGQVPAVASPINLSATPVRYERAPPTLGQHTAEVLREVLELSEEEISGYRARGVI